LSTLDERPAYSKISSVTLVLSNLVPLWFVLFRGWDVFLVVVLYLIELGIIGVINVLRIAICPNKGGAVDGSVSEGPGGSKLAFAGTKLAFISFFIFVYGIVVGFTSMFVWGLFENFARRYEEEFAGDLTQCTIPALVLLGSHLVTFFVNFIGQGQYRKTTLYLLFGVPLARPILGFYATFVMAVFAMFAGNALMEFGIDAHIVPLLMLLGSKIYIDFRMGDFERKRLAGPLPAAPGEDAESEEEPDVRTCPETSPHRVPKVFCGTIAFIILVIDLVFFVVFAEFVYDRWKAPHRPNEAIVQPEPPAQPAAPAVQKPKPEPVPSRSTPTVVERSATTPEPAAVTQDTPPTTRTTRRQPHERMYEYMSYEEVNALLGVTGRRKRAIGSGSDARITYEWRLEDVGVLVTGTLENDRLVSWDAKDTAETGEADEDNDVRQTSPGRVPAHPAQRQGLFGGPVVRQSPPPQQ